MSEKDSLSRDHQLKLEAYRSLQHENSSEARDTMSFDAIFIAGSAAWLFKGANLSSRSSLILLVGYVLLLLLWQGLALRTHRRIRKRVEKMILIEKCVGFCAYRAMKDHIAKELRILKYPYYRAVIGASILLYIVVRVCAHLLAC